MDIDSDRVTISQLLDREKFFRVPDYQRPFSWDDDNLSDLITDLADARSDSDYFLGTLVLHDTAEPGSEVKTYDIVDGQQRLTSLCILLACIRDSTAFVKKSDLQQEIQDKLRQKAQALSGIPALNRLNVRDIEAFNKIVIDFGGTKAVEPSGQTGSASEQRFRAACELFHEKLDRMLPADVESLAVLILQRCVVVYVAAPSFEEAFRLFSVVNDRGQQLRRIDVLKANNLAPHVIANDGDRSHYARKWEGFEEEVGPDVFEDIFHTLRLIYTQDKAKGDLLSEFETRIFGKAGLAQKGMSFIDTLGQYVGLYDSLFISRDYLAGREEAAKFETMMTAMVGSFNASEWRATILQFAMKFGPEHTYQFLLAVERIFLLHWVNGVRKDERYSTYTNLLKTVELATSAKEVIGKIGVDSEPIRAACRSQNFYNASYSKYLLLRAEIRAAELTEPRRFTVRSVEHVLPQNPADGSQWKLDFTTEEVSELVHTAGNLVLLSKSKNSSAQNHEFAKKKARYLSPRVTDFPRSVQVLAEASWTKDLIRQRTEEFADSVLSDP